MYRRGDYKILNAIYDKFGYSVRILPDNDNYPDYKFAKVSVRSSPTFWAWVVQYQGSVQIFESQYRRQLKEFLLDNLTGADPVPQS